MHDPHQVTGLEPAALDTPLDAAWRVPVTRDFVARHFRFHTGQVVDRLRLRYTLLGNPVGAAVLALHGTGGSGRALLSSEFGDRLFGPGAPLDAARHFIVLPDAIGHGGSAKPSDGLRAAFPKYDYDDMVEAQYRVVTEALCLPHLRVVLGVSMGGMHTWLWGTRHAEFMDALVPLSSLPVPMSGRNWLMRRLLIDAIRNDPQWQQGAYLEQPPAARTAWEFFNVATTGGTVALHHAAPTRGEADRWLEARRAQPFSVDANDLLYQYDASRHYDPTPDLDRIRARVLCVLSEDDERNSIQTGAASAAFERIPGARLHLIPGSHRTRGHGTVGMAELWVDALRDFLTGTRRNSRAAIVMS